MERSYVPFLVFLGFVFPECPHNECVWLNSEHRFKTVFPSNAKSDQKYLAGEWILKNQIKYQSPTECTHNSHHSHV